MTATAEAPVQKPEDRLAGYVSRLAEFKAELTEFDAKISDIKITLYRLHANDKTLQEWAYARERWQAAWRNVDEALRALDQ